MTGWHLCYTVRKLIRYCFKVREDNPNDLVSSCRNSSYRIGGFPRLVLLSQNSNAEIPSSLPTIIVINMLKITDRVRLIYGVNVPRSNPNLDINYVSKDNSGNL